MHQQEDHIEEMAKLIALRARRKLGAKASLRLVNRANLRHEVPTAPIPGHLPIFERDIRRQLVRDIARIHGLKWLVLRETAHVDGILERLEDDALVALHDTMQKAESCILEGIGFDDAGLM